MTIDTPTIDPPRRGRTVLAALGITAVTAAALLLPGTAAADPADPTVEQPEYPIPDLPPLGENERYVWQYFLDQGTDSADAGRYGAAFYEWFGERDDIELPDEPPVQVFDNEIWVENTETGESLPAYRLSSTDHGGGWTGPLYFRAPDRKVTDLLSFQVWPKRGFYDGDGETFEYLASCADREEFTDMPMFVDYTCEYTTGPDGEKILTVDGVWTEAGTDNVYGKNRTVIVYRHDGTAVKVQDSIPGFDQTEYPLDPAVDPYLSAEELADLVLSMPDATVGA